MKKLSLIDFKSSVTKDYQILELEKGEEVFVPITTKKQAQEVVRAVNNFDALLEALKLAETTIQRLEVKHGGFSSVQGTLDVIKTAIKNAKK